MERILLITAEKIDIKKKIKPYEQMVSTCIIIVILSFLAVALIELSRGTFLTISTNIAEAFYSFSLLSQVLLIVSGTSLIACLLFLVRFLYLIRKK